MANVPYQPQAVELIVDTPTVRVAEITLAPHTDTPPHEHTEVEEVCYCLEGQLLCAADGEEPTVLRAGAKKTFPAGSDHQLRNASDTPCRVLLVHGVGRFNFVPVTR
jgi:quercetin dioxygenase-like cupin family protein